MEKFEKAFFEALEQYKNLACCNYDEDEAREIMKSTCRELYKLADCNVLKKPSNH